MKIITAIPDSERAAAIGLTIVGAGIILTTPFDLHSMGVPLKFDTTFIYKTPIFWIGTAFWIFWISRIFRIGGYRYSFIGWSLCAAWHTLLILPIILSIIGIVLALGINLIGSALSLIVLLVSWKVFIDFLALREAYKSA
jgi:hypothetical protein